MRKNHEPKSRHENSLAELSTLIDLIDFKSLFLIPRRRGLRLGLEKENFVTFVNFQNIDRSGKNRRLSHF